MAGYSVGNLELSISAIENNTAKSFANIVRNLNSLLKSLTNFEKIDIGKSTGKITSFFNSLNLSLSSVSTESVNSLNTISRSIKTLQTSLSELTQTQTTMAGTQIEVLFNRISTAVSAIDTTKIQTFASVTKSLSSLSNVSTKLQNIDFAKASQGFAQLATAIDPFIQKVKSAEASLVSLDNVLKKTNTKSLTSGLSGGSSGGIGKQKDIAKTLNLAGVLGKLYFIRNYTKQLAQSVVNLVKSAVDYTETLNLWQVAMSGNIDVAEEFIDKMNKAYGIAEATLMQYQATFKNMLSTLGGISADVSYGLSESLTQMALDYASLYNTSIEKAMTVFQSVLSGQVRPIRSISGYDITETTIYELYQQLGGTKTMRQLSQTEKRLLRIYAVFQQMERSGAIGDLNKTLDNTANQMRIMSEAAKELGTWVGKLVELYIAPALPYINAFLITLKNIAQAIVKSLPGYEEFDGTIAGFEDVASSAEEAAGSLLDFDKFRSLSSSEEETSVGIDTSLLAGMSEYQTLLSNVNNTASELAEKWTAIFVDTDTGALKLNLEGLLETLGEIDPVVASIGAGLAGFSIAGLIAMVGKFVSTPSGQFMLTIMGIAAATGAAFTLSSDIITNTDSFLKELLAVISAAELVIGAILAFTGVNIPAGIALMAAGALTLLKEDASLDKNALPTELQGIIDVISGILAIGAFTIGAILAFSGANVPVGLALMAGAVTVGASVVDDWDKLPTEMQTFLSIVMAILGTGLLVIGAILTFSGANMPIGLALMAAGALSLGTAIALNWDSIINALKGPIGLVVALVGGALLAIGAILAFSGAALPLGIGLMVVGAATLGSMIALNWDSIVSAIQGPIGAIMIILGAALIVIGIILLFTGVGVPLGLGLILGGAASLGTAVAFNWDSIVESIKKVWDKIVAFWDEHIAPVFTIEFWKNLGIDIMNGLMAGIEGGINGIIGGFETLINWIITAFNKISIEIPDWGILPREWRGKKFGINIPKASFDRVTLPRFAEGGLPDQGTVFLAGEGGAEIVYNTPSGQSGVANIQQIQQAMYGALVAYGQTHGGNDDRPIDIYIDGERIFRATKKTAKKYGLGFSKT